MDQSMNDIRELSTLDPARGRTLSEAEMVRAEANLERILATPPVTPRPRRTLVRRVVGGSLAAGAATVAIVATSVAGGGAAYASWSATPEHLSQAQGLTLANDCAASWTPAVTLSASDIVLADKRGKGEIVITSRDGRVRLCSQVNPSTPVGWETLADASRFIDSAPAAATIKLYGVETDGTGSDGYSYDVGRVGSNVTGVDILTPKGTVQATVTGGWFVAWWPGTSNGVHDSRKIVLHDKDGQSSTHDRSDFE